MTARCFGATKTFPNNAALVLGLRVKMSAGFLAAAGAGEADIGVMEARTLATDTIGTVRLLNAEGTVRAVASGAITAQADAYSAASGKISATPNGRRWGVAQEAASGDNSVIEVLRDAASTTGGSVEAKTANYTVTTADSGKTFTTVGAAGTVVFAIPVATVGLAYNFRVGAAQELRIDPNGSETIALPSTGVQGAVGKYLTADADGETVSIQCTKAGQWSVFGFTGTWTAEA